MRDDALHGKDSTSHHPIFILVVVLQGLSHSLENSGYAFLTGRRGIPMPAGVA
jgi:hypothetical protein